MKNKNVIHIILDAYCAENINRKIGDKEVTPFLNKLISEGVYFSNLYSQAPYTEAAQVTLLGGKNTLEDGGYLFGNATVENVYLSEYQKKGYHTIFSYSPYVYSKGYLRGVSDYVYTRFYSIEPLIIYRLNYFDELSKGGELSERHMKCCELIVREAFDCWMTQCESLIAKDESVDALLYWVDDIEDIKKIYNELKNEYYVFENDSRKYINNLLRLGKNHPLRLLNMKYVQRKNLDNMDYLLEKYQSRLEEYQKKYTKIAKKQVVDLNYVVGMIFRNRDGKNNCLDTLRTYKHYYENKDVKEYLTRFNNTYKTEIGMQYLFDVFYDKIRQCDLKDEAYYSYIHVQDFHLPSVFHSVDTNDIDMLDREFEEAFLLLDRLDETYRGNIIADLSAHYCDLKIADFFNRLRETLNNKFVFVVTADHGFPLYYNPPRPFIYNQTYEEAFHIPFIMWDGENKEINDKRYSYVDILEYEKFESGIKKPYEIEERKYILTEYAGPGCPDISNKPIWYTYIDETYRVSFECDLDHDINLDKIVSIHNLKKDPSQRKDLFKKKKNISELKNIIEIVNKRHTQLKKKYQGDLFLKSQLSNFTS